VVVTLRQKILSSILSGPTSKGDSVLGSNPTVRRIVGKRLAVHIQVVIIEMLLNMTETPRAPAMVHEKKLAIGRAGDD
jgi:hypothetical protein